MSSIRIIILSCLNKKYFFVCEARQEGDLFFNLKYIHHEITGKQSSHCYRSRIRYR